MDSANSGSMQSSSGGDEEYDSSSHPHDNNFLLNHQTTRSLNHLSAANSSNPSAFLYSNDSYNNILNPFSHSPSTTSTSLYNINNNNNIQDFWSSKPQTTTTTNIINITNTSQNDQTPSTHQSDHHHHPLSQPPDHNNQSSTAPKNPKKRTRASRRAPTTVLTTDTTNFRQMVQEFTGIPAAPFSAATSAFSRRLDLFNTAARGESLIYPLRPSAQKVAANMQPSSSSLYNMGDNSFANIATSLQQNAMNLQGNSMLNYQSMLQSQHQDQANTSQESSRNIPILDDDEVEHFGSFNATNVQLKDGGKGSY